MSMAILRAAAAALAPSFQDNMSWLLTPDNVRGLHLSFDAYWYAWTLRGLEPQFFHNNHLFWEWPLFFKFPPIDLKTRQEFDERFKAHIKDPQMWINHLPEWELRCRSMGYAPNSLPVVFRVIFRDEKRRDSVKELPPSFEGFPIVYETRPPAIGLAASTD